MLEKVRSKNGAPVLSDFESRTGTPLVIDESTGDAYILAATNNIVNIGPNYRSVKSYPAYATGNGDEGGRFQDAIDSLPAGGTLLFPRISTRWTFGTELQTVNGLNVIGEDSEATILRYTGTGTAFSAASSSKVKFRDLCVQLTNNNAIAFGCEQYIASAWQSVRIEGNLASGQRGFSSVISDTSWTSYRNYLENVTLEGLDKGIYLASSVAQYANRWKLIAPKFQNCVDCMDIDVQGIQVVAPEFDEHTGYAIRTGAHGDRLQFSLVSQESNVGGTLLKIDPATNRLSIHGYEVFAGAFGFGVLGTRAFIANWDELTTSDGAGTIHHGTWPIV